MPLSLSLRQQVAQRFVLGYPGLEPSAPLCRFLAQGVGGVIFFRDNFQQPSESLSAWEVALRLADLQKQLPEKVPAAFLSIDQEGGQVERLPHTIFPATLTPRAVAQCQQQDPQHFAESVYTLMAEHLAMLGFNMNFFPTLDVNLEPRNPIIGVRAFGEDPKTVWRLAQVAMAAFHRHNILTVGKHFPGHGNGTVDSHERLPRLTFTETELQPFAQAIKAQVPALMVSHGYYPALQTDPDERDQPASASKRIMQDLLRQQLGYQGLVMSDDMEMGAITQGRDPVQAALKALDAGADLLIYRHATETVWEVFEAVVYHLESGRLNRIAHEAAMHRIAAAKQTLPKGRLLDQAFIEDTFAPRRVHTRSLALARQAVAFLQGAPSEGVLPTDAPVWLLHPDRAGITNYAFDQPTSPELPQLFQKAGQPLAHQVAYAPTEGPALSELEPPAGVAPHTVVFVTWNPLCYPAQAEAYHWLQARYPQARIILVSAGTPYDTAVMPHPTLHLGLCSYRPASMQALVEQLCPSAETTEPQNLVPLDTVG
jgi:beta-N-acetylhexosaminidase